MQRDNEPDMPEINTGKVCFIVVKALELLSEDEGVRPDASYPSDDGSTITLTDTANRPVRQELRQFIDALDADELDALVALVSIGRGDFEPAEWRAAVAEAGRRRETISAGYLFGTPLLPNYLEDTLSAFDRSCGEFGAS
ncbi:DUF3775 domain-containing protein [Rhodoblastus sp. 17X3]|uniref:DUF3775 domain-containing protein n=1 Tax=Rhodoblastus sp. 17X3 TaxID=3047026 RepID=UPI0024B68C86|nr:DUF3775 domain-containing protein [Rhodoblastus sp. 17X3]MDI9848250.1 DUF3775 domain-containing protein [Rhodoblastus sp. 17X3]